MNTIAVPLIPGRTQTTTFSKHQQRQLSTLLDSLDWNAIATTISTGDPHVDIPPCRSVYFAYRMDSAEPPARARAHMDRIIRAAYIDLADTCGIIKVDFTPWFDLSSGAPDTWHQQDLFTAAPIIHGFLVAPEPRQWAGWAEFAAHNRIPSIHPIDPDATRPLLLRPSTPIQEWPGGQYYRVIRSDLLPRAGRV